MGQLEFGSEQGLFEQREVASMSNKRKNCLTYYFIFVIKQTIPFFCQQVDPSGTRELFFFW